MSHKPPSYFHCFREIINVENKHIFLQYIIIYFIYNIIIILFIAKVFHLITHMRKIQPH